MSEREAPPPLDGVTVIDLGQIYNVPYATFLLALHGADVIKVEPLTGEPLRTRDEMRDAGAGIPFQMLNVNKRSMTMDLKNETGRDLLLRLVDHADVLIANFRPGVLDRLGLGPEVVLDRNPRIVYATGSGYGAGSAYEEVPAMDLTVQAMSGVVASTGFETGPPVKAGPAISDFFGAIHLYSAVVTALYRRAVSGVGAVVDVAMQDAVLPSLMSNLGLLLGSATPPPVRTGNRHGGLAASPYNVYSTRDGYMAIIVLSDRHWASLVAAMGRDELTTDPRFVSMAQRVRNIDQVDEAVGTWLAAQETPQAYTVLRTAGIPCAPVRSLAEVVSDDDFRRRGFIVDTELPGFGTLPLIHSPLNFRGESRLPLVPSPALGAHTDEILGQHLGLTTEQIAVLRDSGVVG